MTELFQDEFVEATDTDLDAHTPDVGTAWTVISGVAGGATIKSIDNTLRASNVTPTFTASDDLGITSYYVEATLSQLATMNNRYIAIRVQDTDNFIGWISAGTGAAGMRLVKVVAGVTQNLITTQGVAGVTYRIEVDSTTVRFYGDGAQIGSDITEAAFQTETRQGVITSVSNALSWVDNYAAGDLAAGGAITVTGITPDFSLSAISGAISLTGEIQITGNTPGYNYAPISGSIDLTGEITVTGQTVNYSLSAENGIVDLTGVIAVSGQTPNYTLSAINGGVDLTGELIVTGLTPNYTISSVNGSVALDAIITVVGETPSYIYASQNGTVDLTGEITIIGSTPDYLLAAIGGIVSIGEAQLIGTVTAGFNDSGVSVKYTQDNITTTFKANGITVNFKE